MKSSKLLIVLLSVLLVSACEKIITQKDIELAEKYCDDREGIFSIGVKDDDLVKYITCKNGDSSDSNTAKGAY